MQESGHSPKGYLFGAFEVDLVTREIRRNGRKIKLQDQPFRVLALLLLNYPNMVTREELRKQLWGDDTFVEFDHGLSNAISRIRDALGDSAESARFIETLPKRGYRFIVPVEVVEADPAICARTGEDGMFAGGSLARPVASAAAAEVQTVSPPTPAKSGSGAGSVLWPRIAVGVAVLAALAVMLSSRIFFEPPSPALQYKQLTSFDDEAFSPAVSPDGHMIAFIRGSDSTFPAPGDIYAKLIPNGEPVQLTHDGLPKYGVAFSPDGTQITYTDFEPARGFTTESVSALGGSSRTLLPNAGGLTWLDDNHVLFGEVKTGIHMGLVTSTVARSGLRDIYLPAHERGMAHYGWASPDKKWVLVVEMGPTGDWQPCRLVPFDGSSAGSPVGPQERCTSAAWSPDGKWMYFSAGAAGANHIWREAFPNGAVGQITSGPTEESGVAISADGRSLFTSVGVRESGVWLSDSHGDRLLSSQGYASLPLFSRDGRSLYYLLSRDSPQSPNELWFTDIDTGKSEPLIQGFDISRYDVSSDGKRIVFSTHPPGSPSQIWLASRDRLSSPQMLVSSGGDYPAFDADGDVLFSAAQGDANYLYKMTQDGSGPAKVIPGPILNFFGTSPDGKWALAMVSLNEVPPAALEAVPVRAGAAKRICPALCMARWSPDGKRFYVQPSLSPGGAEAGKALEMPVPAGESFPKMPEAGIRSLADAAAIRGATIIDVSHADPGRCGCNLAPGPANGTFAFVKSVVHRNLYQIPLQ